MRTAKVQILYCNGLCFSLDTPVDAHGQDRMRGDARLHSRQRLFHRFSLLTQPQVNRCRLDLMSVIKNILPEKIDIEFANLLSADPSVHPSLLSFRMNMVPASDEVELEHQPHIGLSGPLPGESPLTPVQDQDEIPVEDALVQPAEKQRSIEIPPPAEEDVIMEKQVGGCCCCCFCCCCYNCCC